MITGIALIDDYMTPWLGRIVVALLILLIGLWVVGWVNKVLLRLMQRSNFDDTLVKFIGRLIYGFLMIAIILMALERVGFNISSLLALLGAAGLAVGLALKDSLSNFAAGVMIIIFRPFKSGDSITTGTNSGVVDEIGIFYTMLNTPDNQRIIIPNSAILTGTIINASTLPLRRIDLIISIGADDSILVAKGVIEQVLAAETRILQQPAASVGVDKLGTTSVDLFVRPWVQTADYFKVKSDLQETLKQALETANIVIPHRPTHVVLNRE